MIIFLFLFFLANIFGSEAPANTRVAIYNTNSGIRAAELRSTLTGAVLAFITYIPVYRGVNPFGFGNDQNYGLITSAFIPTFKIRFGEYLLPIVLQDMIEFDMQLAVAFVAFDESIYGQILQQNGFLYNSAPESTDDRVVMITSLVSTSNN